MSVGLNNELLRQLLALLRTEILDVGGDVAHGVTDSGNPVKIGAYATDPNLVAAQITGRRVNVISDLYGRLRVVATDAEQKFYGIFIYQTGVHTVLAAADAANANRWALFNPTTAKVRLRRILFQTQLSTALVAASAPRIRLRRFTYTPGTFGGGGAISPAKRKTSDTSSNATLQLAATFTGGTLVLGNDVHSWFPCASATAVGYQPPNTSPLEFAFDDVFELVQNEGIILDQPDAGTAADTRKFLTTILTEEYT